MLVNNADAGIVEMIYIYRNDAMREIEKLKLSQDPHFYTTHNILKIDT